MSLNFLNIRDFSFPNNVNIGGGVLKDTNQWAYLEVGKASGSKKGLLLPRGTKENVTPVAGLLFYDTPTAKPWYGNGTEWVPWGSGDGDGGGVALVFTFTTNGTSGPAEGTFDPETGVMNINVPNYTAAIVNVDQRINSALANFCQSII